MPIVLLLYGQGRKKCVTLKLQVRLYMAKTLVNKGGIRGVRWLGQSSNAWRQLKLKNDYNCKLQTSLQRLHDTKSIINICKLCATYLVTCCCCWYYYYSYWLLASFNGEL